MTISTALNRNGTRHPQLMNAELASPMVALTPRKMRLVSARPLPTPNCVNIPYMPRLAVGAYSALSRADPAHSPPTANPCNSRSTSRISGAATPMAAALGTRPTATVDRPIFSRVATKVLFRPRRSPK
jgi:hypothetical protein